MWNGVCFPIGAWLSGETVERVGGKIQLAEVGKWRHTEGHIHLWFGSRSLSLVRMPKSDHADYMS